MPKLLKRAPADHSQRLRLTVQLLFLALNIWIGVEFFLFVRFHETQGATPWAQRPPGVEGWLPIASLMNLKYFLLTGLVPKTHAAGMFLLIAFVTISIVFRKSFCGWLCPIGTISEYLWKLGRQTFRRNWRLPRWADLVLRGAKYILLGLFLYAVLTMSAAGIRAFLDGPYGLVADVKMLNFFRYLGTTGALVVALLIGLSILVQNFWCRYLCPYGALMGLAGWFSPVRIRRSTETCIDCAKCAKACPALLPVDQLVQVRSTECLGCYECVAVCPAADTLAMTLPQRRRLPAWAMAAGVATVFIGVVGYAQWAGYWHTNIPTSTYFEVIPRAAEFAHP